jgi:hypothetical protein
MRERRYIHQPAVIHPSIHPRDGLGRTAAAAAIPISRPSRKDKRVKKKNKHIIQKILRRSYPSENASADLSPPPPASADWITRNICLFFSFSICHQLVNKKKNQMK